MLGKFHCADNGKSAGGNNKKMPGLVRQIWVTYPGKNGKWGERKQLLTHVPFQVVGTASMPHG